MPNEYQWLPLSEIAKHEPEMREKGVSKKARSRGGFLPWYRSYSRRPDAGHRSMADIAKFVHWRNKRRGFIARHLVQYKANPTYRRWLALVAWAYRPDRRFG